MLLAEDGGDSVVVVVLAAFDVVSDASFGGCSSSSLGFAKEPGQTSSSIPSINTLAIKQTPPSLPSCIALHATLVA